jgi:hypothetical protein
MILTPVRTGIVAAKKQTALDTSVTLGNTDAGFRVMNPQYTPAGSTQLIPAGTGNADIGVVTGMFNGGLAFDIQMYEGAWQSILLPACGFDDTAAAGTFLFTDDYSKWKALSMGLWYAAGKKYGLNSAMGNFRLRMPVGMPAIGSFNYKGVFQLNPGTLPAPTWETSLPPVFARSAALTVGGDATIAISNLELSSDDYAFLIPSPNVAGAYVHAWLKKPNFRLRVDPLQTTAKDWISEWLAGTSVTIAAVLDAGVGNKITVGGNFVHVSAPGHQEQDEQKVTPLEFAPLNNSLYIKFE